MHVLIRKDKFSVLGKLNSAERRQVTNTSNNKQIENVQKVESEENGYKETKVESEKPVKRLLQYSS